MKLELYDIQSWWILINLLGLISILAFWFVVVVLFCLPNNNKNFFSRKRHHFRHEMVWLCFGTKNKRLKLQNTLSGLCCFGLNHTDLGRSRRGSRIKTGFNHLPKLASFPVFQHSFSLPLLPPAGPALRLWFRGWQAGLGLTPSAFMSQPFWESSTLLAVLEPTALV